MAEEEEESGRVETIARGVCVSGGKLLLCYAKGASITYLPGGHIEFRETARQALEREIKEEMGLESRAGGFLGCCEHSFLQKGAPHAEINLLFRLEIPGLPAEGGPESREPWIGFRWCPLDRLAEARLEPAPLRALLAGWLKAPGGHVVSGDSWLAAEGPAAV